MNAIFNSWILYEASSLRNRRRFKLEPNSNPEWMPDGLCRSLSRVLLNNFRPNHQPASSALNLMNMRYNLNEKRFLIKWFINNCLLISYSHNSQSPKGNRFLRKKVHRWNSLDSIQTKVACRSMLSSIHVEHRSMEHSLWNSLGIITFVNSTVNFTEISLVHTVNFTAIEHIENNDCSCSRRLLRAPCSSIMIVQSFRVNVWRHEQFIGKLGIRRLVLSFSLCFRLLSIRSAPKCSHFAINPFNRSLHSSVWVCWWDEHLSGQGDDRHCFVGRLFRRCVESLFIFCCPFAKCEWTSILAIIVISQILPWCHDTLSAYACGICLQYDQKRFPFRPSALHLAS